MKYSQIVKLYDELSHTQKRLHKTSLIARFLQQTPPEELSTVMMLLQGRVFAPWDKQLLGLSEKLIIKAISIASAAKETTIMDTWRKKGDLGVVAQTLIEKKTQVSLFQAELSIQGVFSTLQKIASLQGTGSTDHKLKLLAQLYSNAKGPESIYLTRTVLADLRIGIAEGTLRDAIFYAYLVAEWNYDEASNTITPLANTQKEEIQVLQGAIDKTNDLSAVAITASTQGLQGLQQLDIVVGKPLKVMLAQKAIDFPEAFQRVGTPLAVEYKYDGFRIAIHKNNKDIQLFTRRLENVTEQFPDVVEAVKECVQGTSFIIDAEVVGYDSQTGKYKAFQDISQRIRRKYDIELLVKKLPVEVNAFDLLYYQGTSYLDTPFEKRRRQLHTITTNKKGVFTLSQSITTSSLQAAQNFYKESLLAGNEGVIIKKLDANYQPGSRVGTMIKLKPVLDSFDVAIIAAEWGTGKRSGWLTSYTLACFDESTEEFLTLGRFGTGIKEKQEAVTGDDITFETMTQTLKDHIISEQGRIVSIRPDVIVEVKFEEIQKSPSYSSGYALRFPRFVKLRLDRGIQDMTTLSMVEAAYTHQRGR